MKTIEYTPEEGADKGKIFIIRRMSAFEGDRWAMRTIRALIRAGMKIPDNAAQIGAAGLAGIAINIFGNLSEEDCEEAFQGLMKCVQIKRAEGIRPSDMLESDLEDAGTLPKLRSEVLSFNLDFFKAATSQFSQLATPLMAVAEQKNQES